jgi:hypothetical protein
MRNVAVPDTLIVPLFALLKDNKTTGRLGVSACVVVVSTSRAEKAHALTPLRGRAPALFFVCPRSYFPQEHSNQLFYHTLLWFPIFFEINIESGITNILNYLLFVKPEWIQQNC